jgi:hypothetical protein
MKSHNVSSKSAHIKPKRGRLYETTLWNLEECSRHAEMWTSVRPCQEEAARATREVGERGRNAAGARRDETEARLLRESQQARIRVGPDRYRSTRHSIPGLTPRLAKKMPSHYVASNIRLAYCPPRHRHAFRTPVSLISMSSYDEASNTRQALHPGGTRRA